jgi:hypothetical protein
MTETTDTETITQVLAIIDRGLGDISERSLVSSAEVADLLLDVRTILTRRDAHLSVN